MTLISDLRFHNLSTEGYSVDELCDIEPGALALMRNSSEEDEVEEMCTCQLSGEIATAFAENRVNSL
jgi:hypothetical protein